jgi:hypothetical protein
MNPVNWSQRKELIWGDLRQRIAALFGCESVHEDKSD